jgi:hypothetical protein
MSITKKHLNQLAKIVARLHNDKHFSKDTAINSDS